jgi:DNA-directed RNA polymerase subunit RPC12/RpoP
MAIAKAPEQRCPDCDAHPPLVFVTSNQAGFGDGPYAEFHYYRCANCSRKYSHHSGQLRLTPPNQQPKPLEHTCWNCNAAMELQMVSDSFVPEEALRWKCSCGFSENFHHSQLLGFNRSM